MSCLKLNKFILLFFMFFSLSANATFSDMECLTSSFESVVSHKGKPFGLTNTTLKVVKEGCLVIVEHSELKYRHNKWEIDVCREPVHIKSGTGAIEVLKKKADCNGPGAHPEYCKAVKKIELVLQDDGLIFADGEKEDLKTDHGRIYCSFLLLKSYLRNNFVYSRQGEYEDTLIKSHFNQKKETCVVPEKSAAPAPVPSPAPQAVPVKKPEQLRPNMGPNHRPESTPVETRNVQETSQGSIPESTEPGRF